MKRSLDCALVLEDSDADLDMLIKEMNMEAKRSEAFFKSNGKVK